MKVIAVIQLDKEKQEIEIPCGFGDKTFKWLSMIVFQRFSLLSPHGIVRSRDDIRGQTDNDQLVPSEIYLESGDVPHPSCLINDFLRDGDRVFVTLNDKHKTTSRGLPKNTEWHSLAFKNTDSHFNENIDEESEDEDDSETPAQIGMIESKAQFMQLLFKPIMINQKRIIHEVTVFWESYLLRCFPQLQKLNNSLKELFGLNWDLLREVYLRFSAGGQIDKTSYYQFLCAIGMDERISEAQADRVYDNALVSCQPMQADSMKYDEFLASLVLLSQYSFHDTFDKESFFVSGISAVNTLMDSYVIPYAAREKMNAYIKRVFCSSRFLSKLRAKHDRLFEVFQIYLCKSKELPTTLRVELMAEALFDAKLQNKDNLDATRSYLNALRIGSLYSRDEFTSSEFTFAEFVETVARAGLKLKSNQKSPVVAEDSYDDVNMLYEDSFMTGLDMTISILDRVKPREL
jgi:hypothetical protein